MAKNIFFFIIKHGALLGIAFPFILSIKISTSPFGLVHLVLTLIILEYYAYSIHQFLFDFQDKRRKLRIKKFEESKLIDKFLNAKLDYSKSSELLELISIIKNTEFLPKLKEMYNQKIEEKMIYAERLLEKLQHQEEIQELELKKSQLNNNIQYLIKQEKEMTQTEEERKEDLKGEMNLEENKVFEESDLTDEKANFLLEEGYEQTNQYSIMEEGNISVYIKPVLNHSKSHMFLVYELKQILEHWYEAENIEEHLTKDADLTFKYNKKIYALEVETGTLLKKKDQARDKVEYLNRKYQNRWMFIVTNRNQVAKYKKLGIVSERKQVTKNLDKMLKLRTPLDRVSEEFPD